MALHPEAVVRHYIIKDLIARGGMGEVWRAWDNRHNRFVAIKAVASDLLDDPEFKTRFCDELSRHSRLSHPHIAQVLDTFELSGQVCCVMQLIEGQSLAKYLKSRGRLSVEESIPILQDVIGALDYAHRKGIVHRDIKPSNVLLDNEQRAYLIDFGIALAVGERRRTRTGVAIGTPLYMSPEQIVRPQSLDHRTDVYSLGCVLYEMLTGRPPFLPDRDSGVTTEMAIKEAHVKQLPVPPSRRAPGISPAMDRVVLWALEKNPDKRLPGCMEFARLLTEPTPSGKPSAQWQFKNFLPKPNKKFFLPVLIFIFAFGIFYLLLRLLGF